MRIVKVKMRTHKIHNFVDVSKIVAISELNALYYTIYFDNAIWVVEADSYDTVMRAWINSKNTIPNDLKDYVFN